MAESRNRARSTSSRDPVQYSVGSRIGRGREIDLYSAVAGKLTGSIPGERKNTLRAPEDILLSRNTKGIPEDDVEEKNYWLNRHLDLSQQLPDSDLLKAIHTFVSDYYSRPAFDDGKIDMRSMNETALLAFGILLEEAANDMLGRTGDLALVEGQPISTQANNASKDTTRSRSPSQPTTGEGMAPNRKRRRLSSHIT